MANSGGVIRGPFGQLKAFAFRKLGQRFGIVNRSDLHDRLMAHLEHSALATQAFHDAVSRAIVESKPYLVGRPGSFEARVVSEFLACRNETSRPAPYGPKVRADLNQSGGFPLDSEDDIDVFARDYLYSALQADVLSFWRGGTIISSSFLDNARQFVFLNDIDPLGAHLRGMRPWTTALQGKRVLVIHPFRDSILSQFNRRVEIPTVRNLLPDCDVDVLVPPQTYAGIIPTERKGWAQHLQETRNSIASRSFDVAIVGAGPYGLPLAAFVKHLGKVAIHLGGATQLIFAIKGARWEHVAPYADAMKVGWVRPTAAETPPLADSYEESPYW
jgi:hypothetical protein